MQLARQNVYLIEDYQAVVTGNAFGILVAKFRIHKKQISLEPENVSIITMTHFLRRSKSSALLYTPSEMIDICDDTGSII